MQPLPRNLNHLAVLRLLLREPNLSRAAETLGLAQPTVSSALAKMREQFNDPLLVRVGNRMELTARARGLIEPVETVFHAIDQLSQTEDFCPFSVDRNIVIATTDYGTITTLPKLIPRLRQAAPNMSFQFIDMPERTNAFQRANEIDFYMLPNALFKSGDFQNMRFVPLFHDKFVYAVHHSHRLASLASISIEDLLDEDFAIYHLGLEPWNSPIGRPMAGFGEGRKVAIRLQQFSLLPFVAANNSCVIAIPLLLAQTLQAPFGIKVLGDTIPAFEFEFCLAWDPLRQRDPEHEWLREEFKRYFREAVKEKAE